MQSLVILISTHVRIYYIHVHLDHIIDYSIVKSGIVDVESLKRATVSIEESEESSTSKMNYAYKDVYFQATDAFSMDCYKYVTSHKRFEL